MSTINGFGVTRYDWRSRADGTAEATVWVVAFFFPIWPVRREHVCVLGRGQQPQGILGYIAAFLGFGAGFQTEVWVLGSAPLTFGSVAKTYLMGWVVTPVVALAPIVPVVIGWIFVERMGGDREWMKSIVPIAVFACSLWLACFVAMILDRSAGRSHVYRRPELPDALATAGVAPDVGRE